VEQLTFYDCWIMPWSRVGYGHESHTHYKLKPKHLLNRKSYRWYFTRKDTDPAT